MSHSQVNQLIHVMWSTEDLINNVTNEIKDDLLAYITAILKNFNVKVFAITSSLNHIHILLSMPPNISLTALLAQVKACSSKWIKSHKNATPNFSWQNGYLAISTQSENLDKVCSYIRSDDKRHASIGYREEILSIFKLQNIEYNEKYFLQNSFAKIYIHAIWSTYKRIPFLHKSMREFVWYDDT